MMRRGRLGLVNRGQESQNKLKELSARIHSDQMVLMIARQEAGLCEWRLNSRATFFEDGQMSVEKQLLAAKSLTGK
jgi:hypothetical protein